jgi:hypothetical protein
MPQPIKELEMKTVVITFTSGSAGTAISETTTVPIKGLLQSILVDSPASGSGLTVRIKHTAAHYTKTILGPVNVTTKTEYFPRGFACTIPGVASDIPSQPIPLDGTIYAIVSGAGDTKTGKIVIHYLDY